jgi:hypothetical protein
VQGGNCCQHEAGGEFNTRDSQVPLPRADLDVAGDDFAVTCTDEEGLKLMEDSTLMTGRIVEMVPVHIE